MGGLARLDLPAPRNRERRFGGFAGGAHRHRARGASGPHGDHAQRVVPGFEGCGDVEVPVVGAVVVGREDAALGAEQNGADVVAAER